MPRDDRLIIELPRNGNLDVVLRMFISTLGAGLQAIALALSTPHDNSAQVQAEIDKYVNQLRASTNNVQSAIDQSKGD